MIAKFETNEVFYEYFRYMRKQMVAIISFGIVFFVMGVVLGVISIIFGFSIVGILAIALCMIVGIFYIFMGASGVKQKMKNNSLLVTASIKTITFYNDDFITQVKGENYSNEAKIGYMHVLKVIDNDDFYAIILRNKETVICMKDTLSEGSLDELNNRFTAILGKAFVRRKSKITVNKQGRCAETVCVNYAESNIDIENSTHEDINTSLKREEFDRETEAIIVTDMDNKNNNDKFSKNFEIVKETVAADADIDISVHGSINTSKESEKNDIEIDR